MNQLSTNLRRFRYSLRHLFAVMTGVAVGITMGLLIAAWVEPRPLASPDQDEFWIEWFANGTSQERRAAVGVIAYRAQAPQPDRQLLDALIQAASDGDPHFRIHAVVGLQLAARTNDEVRAVLQNLADNDPDAMVRIMARQALAEGVPALRFDHEAQLIPVHPPR